MASPPPSLRPQRLLIVLPIKPGDCVMATPTLRSIRELLPEAHITALIYDSVRSLLEGCVWIDRFMSIELADGPKRSQSGIFAFASRLRQEQFDAAVLLPNSFRSASLAAIAGIPRRVGYDGDGRSFLLTDRLIPRRMGGKFVSVSALSHYLGLAGYLGAVDPDLNMELPIDPEDAAAVSGILAEADCDLAAGDRLVLINPGASKSTKHWPEARYAMVANQLAEHEGCHIAVTGSPSERNALSRIAQASTTPIIDLAALGIGLRQLKSVIKAASLLITNDTGPRQIAAAFGTPTVSLFGSTAAEWTRIEAAREQLVFAGDSLSAPSEIERITTDQVLEAADKLLASTSNGLTKPQREAL